MSRIPEADEKGAADQGLKAAATAVLSSRHYGTTEPERVLVSLEALSRLADALDNPAVAQVIRSTLNLRRNASTAIATIGEGGNG